MSQSSPRTLVGRVLRVGLAVVDRITDALALSALIAMILVISWQVFARYVLGFTPGWSSETALLLLCWLAFLGIAKGIRDHSHIAVGLVVDRLPALARQVAARVGPALMAAFGIYLIVQGGEFTSLMMNSTLPGTGLPTSVQYAAMPTAGVLITFYSALQVFGLLTPPGTDSTGADHPDAVGGADRADEADPEEGRSR
ncbi:TRAP transporter small permease [Saccharomonospora saliphila]|uniref:TRAP transporter small permease n=1 Tax=Saccharomonospora saliphila TaxID=369829 RepID=UPI00037FA1A7|nr:TRAP transporter small permease [Saccharomonospora saliphila]